MFYEGEVPIHKGRMKSMHILYNEKRGSTWVTTLHAKRDSHRSLLSAKSIEIIVRFRPSTISINN